MSSKLNTAVTARRSKKGAGPRDGGRRKAAPVAKALASYPVRDPNVNSSKDSVTIVHREFIQDVTGQTAFTVLSLPINPGRDVLFPWLSDIAARYDRYQFESLRFLYEPRCSTATAGSVILAVDFDPLDALPQTKQDVYSYHKTAPSSAWDDCTFNVDVAVLRNKGTLFTRPGAIPSSSDLKTYDLGNFFLCVSGFSGALVCGELFVEYRVRLTIPHTQSNIQSASYAATAGVSTAAPFGTAPLVLTGLLDASLGSGGAITFQQNWSGVISVNVVGTVLATIGLGGSTATCSVTQAVNNAAGTAGLYVVSVVALRGQTVVFTPSATSWSAMGMQFAPTA